jgi:uncharacterized membrane protein YhhN
MKHRWLWIVALVAGLSYPLGWHTALSVTESQIWKGAGVALLAVWAAMNARNTDGWLIAAVMALGALGDVLLELSQSVGALTFLAGHITAIVLYLRNRRGRLSNSQRLLALLVIPLGTAIAFLLPADRAAAPGIAVYALGLTAMVGAAWTSCFPRYRVGLGGVFFMISDLLIFARLGPLAGAAGVGLTIWLLYFVGQAMVATGVVTTLARWRADYALHHRL